jgi:uncharacterized iron-regulated protein
MDAAAMKLALFLLLGCLFAATSVADERILDTRDSRELTHTQLVSEIKGRDFILLGELHDNAAHHRARAKLLAMLQPVTPVVVAEHLQYGKVFTPRGDLLADLKLAGFDVQGWEWPLHRPLFQTIADLELPLLGGNLAPAQAKQVVREGLSALPDRHAQLIARHPLPPAAQQALDRDLGLGHCGHMPGKMVPGMRLAQRARDAAMLDTLQNTVTRPAVLIAGNGHVRKDYGVPSLMDAQSYVSVGFAEEPVEHAQDFRQFDYLWITEPALRDDPCAVFHQTPPHPAK